MNEYVITVKVTTEAENAEKAEQYAIGVVKQSFDDWDVKEVSKVLPDTDPFV